jgi:UDP-N-acetylglucosamine 2-epimerase
LCSHAHYRNLIEFIFYNLKKILNSKKNFKFKNPYGRGGASNKIIRVLENLNYNSLLKKSFYDIPNKK